MNHSDLEIRTCNLPIRREPRFPYVPGLEVVGEVVETAGEALDAVALSDDGTLAIAAGAHGTILERVGEAAWQRVSSGTTADLHAAVIVGEGSARHYVAGESGTLLESVDRGISWSEVTIGTHAALYSLDDL